MIKPAEQTPLSTLRLVKLIQQAGVPAGVVNVVTGGPETGRALVEHPLVAKVSFTGLTEVGREIGGKAPSILGPDADTDAVIEANLMGGVLNSGQICAAYTRFYVPHRRAGEFADKLSGAAASLTLGSGLDPATHLGPLVSAEQVERVDRCVQIGQAEGAQLLTGGRRPGGGGR